MIDLVQKLGPMKETVCRAYVHAELKGEIARTKTRSSQSPEGYAETLWNEGIKKGWLPAEIAIVKKDL